MSRLEILEKISPKVGIQIIAVALLFFGATASCAPSVELPVPTPSQIATATFTPTPISTPIETPIPTPRETFDPATFPKCGIVGYTVYDEVMKLYAPDKPPLKINGQPVFISVAGGENIPIEQIYNPNFHKLDIKEGKKICVGVNPQGEWEIP